MLFIKFGGELDFLLISPDMRYNVYNITGNKMPKNVLANLQPEYYTKSKNEGGKK